MIPKLSFDRALGALTVIVWKEMDGGIFDMYEIPLGFILCAPAILGVSLMDKPPETTIQAEFDVVDDAIRG
jgi:sodium/proline symporter